MHECVELIWSLVEIYVVDVFIEFKMSRKETDNADGNICTYIMIIIILSIIELCFNNMVSASYISLPALKVWVDH